MVTEAQKKAKAKYYKEHIKRVAFELQIHEYERIKASAEAEGKAVNTFIKDCVWDKIGKPQKGL